MPTAAPTVSAAVTGQQAPPPATATAGEKKNNNGTCLLQYYECKNSVTNRAVYGVYAAVNEDNQNEAVYEENPKHPIEGESLAAGCYTRKQISVTLHLTPNNKFHFTCLQISALPISRRTQTIRHISPSIAETSSYRTIWMTRTRCTPWRNRFWPRR